MTSAFQAAKETTEIDDESKRNRNLKKKKKSFTKNFFEKE